MLQHVEIEDLEMLRLHLPRHAFGGGGENVLLPLAIPVLIFGAGALEPAGASAFKLIAACSMLLLAIAPFAAGAAIRAMRE